MSDPVLVHDGMPDLVPMQGRSPGVHVSHVIRALCLRLGHYEERAEGPNLAMFGLGNALEHAIVQRYTLDQPGRYIQPGELELDGLFGTPDMLDTGDWAVHEIKLTWMSSRHEPDSEKFWKYWVQLKAYCRMMDIRVGRLHVCFVNGDYKQSGPQYRVWEQHFTERELAENWRMLRSHAEVLRREGGKHE